MMPPNDDQAIPKYIWSTFDEATPKGATKTLDKAFEMLDLFAERGYKYQMGGDWVCAPYFQYDNEYKEDLYSWLLGGATRPRSCAR